MLPTEKDLKKLNKEIAHDQFKVIKGGKEKQQNKDKNDSKER